MPDPFRPFSLRLPARRGVEAARVKPEDLNVAPGVLGLPLAPPWRRLLAMLIDLCAIGLLSALGSVWWLAAGALLLGERAWVRRHGPSRPRRWTALVLAAGLLVVGVQQAAHERPHAASAEAEDPDDIEEATVKALQQRLQALEVELAAARAGTPASAVKPAQPPAPRWRERLAHLLDELGLGYGWSIVYFTLLPAWWRGQTLGKRLMRLRVLEIAGKPMTAMRCLRRYGGYVAGMATGGLGLAQVLWDSNRQGLQDKTAHTVVVDERGPPAAPPVSEPPPALP